MKERILFASMLVWDLGKTAAGALRRVLLDGPARIPAPVAAQQSGRAADRDIHPGNESTSDRHWGTFWVACVAAFIIAAGVGFLFIYWSGGSNQLLGVTLAIFLGGLGVSLVLYSHRLIVQREATEAREELPSSTDEREALVGDFCAGVHDASRRGLLTWIGATAVAFMAAIIVSLFRSLGAAPDAGLFSIVWKRGQRLTTSDGTPVTVNALQQGNTMIVFPENSIGDERAQTVLIRVDEKLLRLPRERADWAPMGYLAYSRVCTHAGCSVGLYETTSDQLMCPCHQSTFDVLRAAQPTGGPAARPLPQLPLYADADGFLRAAGGFSEPPGPGFWGMP